MKASAGLNDKDGWTAAGRCRREKRNESINETNQLMRLNELFHLIEWFGWVELLMNGARPSLSLPSTALIEKREELRNSICEWINLSSPFLAAGGGYGRLAANGSAKERERREREIEEWNKWMKQKGKKVAQFVFAAVD